MTPSTSSLRDRVAARPVPVVLLAVAALAVLVRLVQLGHRVFYYDEAWFGYFVLRSMETGAWEYEAILHGPFYARVNAWVFPILGVSDFSARFAVALLGGLLPLSAWLFREHLRDVEVVALAVALAFNPILLYYSRFMRKDFPLAACMLIALGLFVRAHDTDRAWYGYAAAAFLGGAFATKESVLLWMVTWAGAGALVLDYHFLRARHASEVDAITRGAIVGGAVLAILGAEVAVVALVTAAFGGGLTPVALALAAILAGAGLFVVGRARLVGYLGQGRARARVREFADRLAGWTLHAHGAALVFLVVVVYFYAPRAGGGPGIGLWKALGGQFGTLPDVVGEATLGSIQKAIDYWVEGSIQDHAYLPYLEDTLRTLRAGALGIGLLAVLGFLHDRYAGDEPRNLVAFNFYCGVAATVGYPIANNLPVPWSTVHAVVPLAVPAAVGAGVVYRWGRGRLATGGAAGAGAAGGSTGRAGSIANGLGAPRSLRDGPALPVLRAGLAAGVLVFLVASAGATAYETSFAHPHDSPRGESVGNEIVYYAQAPGELREVADAIGSAAADGDDLDVLYVGSRYSVDPAALDHSQVPIPWYTAQYDADLAQVNDPGQIDGALGSEGDGDPPPVVITTPGHREAVAAELGSAYEETRHPLDDVGDRSVVVFLRTD